MQMVQVKRSTNVAAFGYDGERRTLVVEFKGGSRYAYRDVPDNVFAALRIANETGQSVGGLLRQMVTHNAAYPFEKLEREPSAEGT